MSHSIAKSVINALIGILVRDGKVSIADRVPLAGRDADGDAGDGATVDQLLRMSSGLLFAAWFVAVGWKLFKIREQAQEQRGA